MMIHMDPRGFLQVNPAPSMGWCAGGHVRDWSLITGERVGGGYKTGGGGGSK